MEKISLPAIALLALFGAFGALARHGLGLFLTYCHCPFPWRTACVNILGCFGFGIATALCARGVPPELKLAIITGFFGAFTTFSTLIFEMEHLLTSGQILTAVGSFLLQNLVGFAALYVGMRLIGE